MLHIVKPNEIESVIGKDLGASDWMVIDQERIDKFADATMDHQFIHVDPDQAEPIFGSTIAHGFLSLSLVAGISFEQEIGMVLEGTKMGMNYGLFGLLSIWIAEITLFKIMKKRKYTKN